MNRLCGCLVLLIGAICLKVKPEKGTNALCLALYHLWALLSSVDNVILDWESRELQVR